MKAHTLRAAAVLALVTILSAAPVVRAMGIEHCSVSAPATMLFQTDLTHELTSVTSFEVACTVSQKGGPPFLTIGLSAGTSGSEAQRLMRAGANVLLYDLYQDYERKQPWGNTPRTQLREHVMNSFRKTYTIYGKIRSGVPNLNARAGQYIDAPVVITLGW